MSASRRYDGRRFYWIIYMSKKQKPRNLLEYVKPVQGTNSVHTFSQGNTLPLVARPFAMTHWAPQTEDSARFYQPTARHLQGIRATHQPSPWIGDYGHFLFCPQSGRRFLQGSQFVRLSRRGYDARPALFSHLFGTLSHERGNYADGALCAGALEFSRGRAGALDRRSI